MLSPSPSLDPSSLTAHANQPQEKRYQLLEVLGEGSAGTTYLAQAEDSATPVALKLLTLRGQTTWDNVERIEREAKVLARLRHSGIPRYIDHFHIDSDDDRLFCIVQQLAEGQSLAQRVEQGWRCNEREVRAIAQQLLKTLSHLHQQQPPVIHRDIKPQNLIISPKGLVRLVDFGSVQNAYFDSVMGGRTMAGTFGYMAPEQFQGQASPATDLYGLGATLVYLLTHRSPTELPMEDLRLRLPEAIAVSEDFRLWLDKLLEPDRADRFASTQEALAALDQGMPRAASRGFTRTEAVVIGGLAIATLGLINLFKFPILSRLGFTPREMFESGINSGNVAVVEKYLDKGVSPNSRAYNGNTLLHWAVSNGRAEVVDLLIERGADLDQTYKPDDRTVFHLAVQHDNPELTAILIKHGASVDAGDRDGNTPLHKALLKDDVNRYYGMTNTSTEPSTEIVQQLLQAGAALDRPNDQGVTPRQLAEIQGLSRFIQQ